jgi:acyl carrier protein
VERIMSTINNDQIRTAILEVLGAIAPELDPAGIKPDKPLRDQVDLDSFDFLNVIIALHERLGVDIPESDYRKLVTLEGMVEYLAARRSSAGQVGSGA